MPWPYGPYNIWNQVPYPAYQTGKDASNSIEPRVHQHLQHLADQRGGVRIHAVHSARGAQQSERSLHFRAEAIHTDSSSQTSPGLIPNVEFEGGNTEIANDQLYIAGGEAPPFLGAQNTYTFNDALTKLLGKHLLKAGFYAEVGLLQQSHRRQRQRLSLDATPIAESPATTGQTC